MSSLYQFVLYISNCPLYIKLSPLYQPLIKLSPLQVILSISSCLLYIKLSPLYQVVSLYIKLFPLYQVVPSISGFFYIKLFPLYQVVSSISSCPLYIKLSPPLSNNSCNLRLTLYADYPYYSLLLNGWSISLNTHTVTCLPVIHI